MKRLGKWGRMAALLAVEILSPTQENITKNKHCCYCSHRMGRSSMPASNCSILQKYVINTQHTGHS